ncbi:MAG: SIS domain-containing protein [Gammaproteobacteria bacterium]|nr:SIS domain-containing protein [Gammaproteobacteria bacterium]
MSDNTESLHALYPFLHGQKKEPVQQNAALLDSIQQKAEHSRAEKKRFFAKNGAALLAAATSLAKLYQQQHRLYSMGNGGSSCDAAHFAVEFQHPVTAGRPALPAHNLSADNAMMTAVGNDVGMAQIFSRQLEAYGQAGDGLVGFSTSGNSENLLKAYQKAKQIGMVTLGFTGGDGGEMRRSGLLDHCLVVESDSIHRVQEIHLTCYHILWDLTHTLLADQRGNLGNKT